MEFASEMVVKSALNKLKITEVPTTLSKDGRTHPPHLNTWTDGWRHLRFLLLFSPRWLFLYPGLSFLVTGFILSMVLLWSPIYLGKVRLDVQTLLYTATLFFTGFQFISFYCFSKIFAVQNKLLPEDWSYFVSLKMFALERGIIVGFVLIVAGFLLSVKGFYIWESAHFGDLSPTHTLRLMIPAIVLIILGIQVIQNSFFVGMLTMKK